MIELKNISARTVVPYDAYGIKELAKKTGAVSAEDVLELITKYPEYNWSKVIKMFGMTTHKHKIKHATILLIVFINILLLFCIFVNCFVKFL